MNILHILNGDATLIGFENTGLDGEVMVWREIFSQGPVEDNVSSARFWRHREAWLRGAFGETTEGYQQKMLDQLSLLDGRFSEINLWFEFDLHCQANLLGVMAYLQQKTDLSAPSVYLICPGDFPGKENFRGMGELNADELEYLYDNIREQLSLEDFEIAANAWRAYVAKDADILNQFITDTEFWGSLHFLKPALEAEVKRLTFNDTGLNYIEQKLLDIYNYGFKTNREIYQKFWETEKIYGMGDSEIDICLNNLRSRKLIE